FAGAAAIEIRDDLSRESLLAALEQSRVYLGRLPDARVVASRPRKITAGDVKATLTRLAEMADLWRDPQKFSAALRARFEMIVPAAAEQTDLLVTGYYQPVIEGSLIETPVYRYPIYRKPDDLLGVMPRISGEKIAGPYLSRRDIDVLGALKGKGYEIAWVKD